jgi:hypothetical protein
VIVRGGARRAARRPALLVLLVILLALLGRALVRLSDPAITPHDDFISSWAAGRLHALGHDPYDPAAILAEQQAAGWPAKVPYRVWYPPWIMPLLAPFGLLPYPVGRLLWFVVHLTALLVCADRLWRYYGGDPRSRGVAWLVLSTFWPAVIDLRTGQTSAFLLLGLVGFLHFERRRLWGLAGASLVLVSVKPQFLHLVWIAVALWAVTERHWGVLLGAAAAGLALLVIALGCDPLVVAQFLHMAERFSPQPMVSSIGELLRVLVRTRSGQDAPWLLFVPPLLSVIWFASYWRRHRAAWDWQEQMPVVVFVSVVTTCYAWIYDYVVLLIPVMQVAVAVVARRTRVRPPASGF